MKYFCKIRLESGKNSETTLFLILDATGDEVPQPDKRLISECREYRLFMQGRHAKTVMAEYTVYRTETEITANLENSRFEKLIADGNAETVASGEMRIDRGKKHKAGSPRGKKKTLLKIAALLEELCEHPTTGTGKVEQLKGDLEGYWSRRINKASRLIYKIEEDIITVFVISLKGHYGDK